MRKIQVFDSRNTHCVKYKLNYFAVLMPASFLIILFEEMSLATQIDSFLVPLTVAMFAGTGFYLGTKRRYGQSIIAGRYAYGGVIGPFKDDASRENILWRHGFYLGNILNSIGCRMVVLSGPGLLLFRFLTVSDKIINPYLLQQKSFQFIPGIPVKMQGVDFHAGFHLYPV